MTQPFPFPFSALVGRTAMKQATAIAPGIGKPPVGGWCPTRAPHPESAP